MQHVNFAWGFFSLLNATPETPSKNVTTQPSCPFKYSEKSNFVESMDLCKCEVCT